MLNCVTQSTDFQFLQIFETAESDYTSQLDLHFIENLTIWEGDKIEKKIQKGKNVLCISGYIGPFYAYKNF